MTHEEEVLRQVVELEVYEFCEPDHEACYSDEILLRIIRRAIAAERGRLLAKMVESVERATSHVAPSNRRLVVLAGSSPRH